ncbi:uncharacterized protein [Lolium perenne]|uniref:uncharacterized protein n=1 Tax=Lolium perenne TaxID=4522 RepID=UPI0021F57887|nr:uncharacterized protein LOC127310789 [Lolium perenne]
MALDDDDLLAEIIVRLGCPASLVRAATVCRRWLQLASDHAFLRRFRKLHPPRLLGFYLGQGWYTSFWRPRFFSMVPQLPTLELPAVVRRACFDMVGCWNGRVLTSRTCTVLQVHGNHSEIWHDIISVLHTPTCPQRGTTIIPTLRLPTKEGIFYAYRQLFFKEEGKVLSYFYLTVKSTIDGTKSTVHVYMLQNGDDAWRTHLTLAADYFVHARYTPGSILVGNKIYMSSARNEILVLDLTAAFFSTIQLPQGVDFGVKGTTMLSRADDGASDVYLIHAKELQLHVWLRKAGNSWLLVDNICLRDMCAHLLEDEPTAFLKINQVGDYTAEFLFLEMGRWALHLDVKSRTLRKVAEGLSYKLYNSVR